MTDDFKFPSTIRVAMADLASIVTEEKVPDPGDGYRDFFGLPPELRRILFVLDRIAINRRRKQLEERTAVADSRIPEPAAPQAPSVLQPPSKSVFSSGHELQKYVPTEEFDAPSPSLKAPMTTPTPPRDPVAKAAPSSVQPAQETPPVPAPSMDTARPQAAPAGPVSQPEGAARPPASGNPTISPIEMVKKTVYLKNARANEAYEGAVEIEGFKDIKLENAGGSGLTLDPVSGLLKGTPATSGDFVIRLLGLFHGKRCEVTANLAVIADPKSLWVSKDSDRNDSFWKPDQAFRRIEGDLLCVAASKRGRSHAKDGGFRDDDFGLLAHGPGGWHIAAVADGAGSAKYSRRGSKVAVDCVLQGLPGLLDEHLTPHLAKLVPAHQQGNPDATGQIKSQLYQSLATAAFQAAKAIEEEAASHDAKASAFSTTLIVVVVRQIPGGWFIAGFSVGDGGAAVFDIRDGSLTPLTLPDSGEFAGQTRFLQRSEFAGGFEEVAKRIFFDVRKEFTAIALMTDGISDPKFPTDAVFATPARWATFWNDDLAKAVDFSRTNNAIEAQFLEWLDFWSPGNHDDRTLAILVP
ncbi:protein phosphatase 2C domain-containing protein [Niveispirillum sp. BGYR6]|uniref:PP2C family serine/threonine-protein phosphatase n=1 Tax=Niveispirillum sp. BGYR6 TaxID=2971249 RepID=UPI0022B96A2E|nr:protein phosphatase 2C domain-containing protein [Niveispirillum sp. BGYR6]MDG5496019.1 protein phosphatase 2C domain-containing protein [Niveispirillum sp. BGYR6]